MWTANSRCRKINATSVTGCVAVDIRGPCYDQGGAHWLTKEAAVHGRGHGASHHPPAGIHRLRGETLAWLYAHILLDALDYVHTRLKGLGEADLCVASASSKESLAAGEGGSVYECGREPSMTSFQWVLIISYSSHGCQNCGEY